MKDITLFITESTSTPLSDKELEELTKYFRDLTDNCEIIINNKYGSMGVYFPDRKTLQDDTWERVGLSNIPHLAISKPSRLKGGFCITIYKKGRWAASEFPDRRRAFDENGKPKYSTVEDLIEIFDKNIKNGKWKDDLDIQIK